MQTLKCSDYRRFCELHGSVFDEDNYIGVPPPGLVYVPLDRIAEFFRLCNYTDNEYVVVSAMSDYGIEYQSHKSVSSDMGKWVSMITSQIQKNDLRYEPLHIPARCNLEECKLSDKFSVKMYSYTGSTFDSVPKNVRHWFCTNMNVDLPRTTKIPFGVADWTPDKFPSSVKTNKLYVNFQANTVERFNLTRGLKNIDWAVVESNIPHDMFSAAMSTYAWVLCPEGNGLDSYRVLEALSAGAIPVMLRRSWNSCYYENFPVILLDKWEDLSYNSLVSADFSLEATKKDFWINKIKEQL